jgi:hypothetical protein
MLVAHLVELPISKVFFLHVSAQEIGCEDVDFTHPDQDSVQWQAVVNMIILCHVFQYQTPSSDAKTN